MKWLFDFAGMHNARAREVSRMAAYARACMIAGEDVSWSGSATKVPAIDHVLPAAMLRQISKNAHEDPDVYVCSSEAFITGELRLGVTGRRVILIANGKRYPWYIDAKMADWASVVLGGRWSPRAEELYPGTFMPACHPVGEAFMGWLLSSCMLEEYYLTDRVKTLRMICRAGMGVERPTKRPGFIGVSDYNRRSLAECCPPDFDCEFDRRLNTPDYVRWMLDHEAVLDFPGQIPRTFRFTEAVLLGIPVIANANNLAVCEPPITARNAIIVDGWGDHGSMLAGLANREAIVEHADACYFQGWSILGQIRSIIRRLEA